MVRRRIQIVIVGLSFLLSAMVLSAEECELLGIWKTRAERENTTIGYGLLVIYDKNSELRYIWTAPEDTLDGKRTIHGRIDSDPINTNQFKFYVDEDGDHHRMKYEWPPDSCGDAIVYPVYALGTVFYLDLHYSPIW